MVICKSAWRIWGLTIATIIYIVLVPFGLFVFFHKAGLRFWGYLSFLSALALLFLLTGCLSMGAKLEVEKILEERESEWVRQAEEASRRISNSRTEEILVDRIPGMVSSRAYDVATNRSLEILESKIPGAVRDELSKAGISREFVLSTEEELSKTDWAGVVTSALTLLIGAFVTKKELESRSKNAEKDESSGKE